MSETTLKSDSTELIQQQEKTRQTRWNNVGELLATEFPPPRWTIPGLIPAGLIFLAGRPKLGKSWLALQIAHAKTTGGCLFGQKTEKGKVLYLALEDGGSRLQERCKKQGIPNDAEIAFETNWPVFDKNGLTRHWFSLMVMRSFLSILDEQILRV